MPKLVLMLSLGRTKEESKSQRWTDTPSSHTCSNVTRFLRKMPWKENVNTKIMKKTQTVNEKCLISETHTTVHFTKVSVEEEFLTQLISILYTIKALLIKLRT